jgi:hypothetical protein
VSMSDSTPAPDDALLSRLRLIEDQPLEQRAAAFSQVYDELQAALENADSPRTS